MFPVIYIMGVSGCGKTTIGEKLSGETGIPFFDGDDYHSVKNKEKMHSGIPLTDDDRQEWLKELNEKAKKESRIKGAIIACSALKEKYRKQLSDGIEGTVYWVFLKGDYNIIYNRINERKGHYMPARLLRSQFDALEYPDEAIMEDIEKTPDEIVTDIISKLRLKG